MAAASAYATYRPSGLPWVPQLSQDWQVLRNGRLFGHRVETGFPDLPILEVSLRTGVRVRDMENLKRKQVMSQKEKYKRAIKGDIAYNMMRMWQGAVGPAPVDGLVSPAYVVVRPYDEANSSYYSYLFRTAAYMQEVNKFSRGIVADRNRLYWESFKQMPSLVPPRPEQDQIVAYLRAQDAHIARFIKAKRELIKLLTEQKLRIIDHAVTRGLDASVALKPSGIEWLGEVPEHWEVKPLKRWVRLNASALGEKTDPDFEFRYVDIGSVQTGRLVKEPAPRRLHRAGRARDVPRAAARSGNDANPAAYRRGRGSQATGIQTQLAHTSWSAASRVACWPVNSSHRRTITSTYFGSSSISRATRPDFSAAISVVPEPPNGSSTTLPGRLELRIARSTSSTGFIVGCRSFFCGFLIFQTSP